MRMRGPRRARPCGAGAIWLWGLAGPDASDPATADADAKKASYRAALENPTLAGRRIGIVRSIGGDDDRGKPILDEVVRTLRAAGAVVIDPVVLPHLGDYDGDEMT